MEDVDLVGFIKGLVVLFVVIAIPLAIVHYGTEYWPVSLVIVAAIVGLVIYRKRRNMV